MNSTNDISPLLTMTQVVHLLKIQCKNPSRKARYLLRSIEEQRQTKILIERNKRFYTTYPLLKNALPELFEKDIYTQQSISFLKEQIHLLNQKVIQLSNKVKQLEGRK